MNDGLACVSVLISTIVALGADVPGEARWHADLDVAQGLAAERGGDLLIEFTGSTWCGICTKFDHDVLGDPAVAAVVGRFIPVRLDYPASLDDLPAEDRERFARWRDRYGVNGFPTVVLIDAAGRPYAVTGYQKELDPAEYAAHLEELRKTRERRDAALAAAGTADGLEKARRIAEALDAVRDACAAAPLGIDEHPLPRFYRAELDQVFTLDAENRAGMKARFSAFLAAEDTREGEVAAKDRIEAAYTREGPDAAVAAADEALRHADDGPFRHELRRMRVMYLEREDRNEDALAYARGLADDPVTPRSERGWLLTRAAFNLKRLGRIDEALAVHDRLAAEADGDRDLKWRRLRDKAEVLTESGRLEDAAATWKAALPHVEPGTVEWIDNQVLRARLLARLDRHAEAADIYRAAVPHFDRFAAVHESILLAETATALARSGRAGEAADFLERAEAALAEANPAEDARAFERAGSRVRTAREAVSLPGISR